MKECHKVNIDFDDDTKSKITREVLDNGVENGTIKTVDLFNQKMSWYEKLYYPLWKTKDFIKNTYYKIKYGFQRMFRGYDDPETYNVNSTFLSRYTKILKELREWGNSYPFEFSSYDDWLVVLDEMINHFELSDAFHDSYKDMKYIEAEPIAYQHANKALEMFVKYFWDLWD